MNSSFIKLVRCCLNRCMDKKGKKIRTILHRVEAQFTCHGIQDELHNLKNDQKRVLIVIRIWFLLDETFYIFRLRKLFSNFPGFNQYFFSKVKLVQAVAIHGLLYSVKGVGGVTYKIRVCNLKKICLGINLQSSVVFSFSGTCHLRSRWILQRQDRKSHSRGGTASWRSDDNGWSSESCDHIWGSNQCWLQRI